MLHALAAWRPAFPDRCLVFATLALIDFVQTSFILSIGGHECNELALWILQRFGLAGAAFYKFALVAGVIGLIEYLARRDLAASRRLTGYALVLGALPVLVGVTLILMYFALQLV